jgi:hypothetical protein
MRATPALAALRGQPDRGLGRVQPGFGHNAIDAHRAAFEKDADSKQGPGILPCCPVGFGGQLPRKPRLFFDEAIGLQEN